MRGRGSIGAIVAALLLTIGVGAAQGAEPLKIRIGWVVTPSELPPILFAKEGIARHLGKSYTVEAIHFAGTPLMITPLAAGELDIAPLAYSTFATAVLNAGISDLRIIADEFQDGVEGYYSDEYFVLADSPIRTVEDLKGKVLASNGVGSAVDMAMRAMLKRHGLEDKRDYSVIEVQFPNMRATLAEHKVDLICGVPPFSYDPALRKIARPLFLQRDAVGPTQMIVWTARAGFLAKNRAAVGDFMEDALRALRWYIDPANRKEMLEIVAQYTKQPTERFADWLFTKADYYRDPDGLPNLAALQRNIQTQRELGFLKADLSVGQYADLSFVKEAARRLKQDAR